MSIQYGDPLAFHKDIPRGQTSSLSKLRFIYPYSFENNFHGKQSNAVKIGQLVMPESVSG